MRLIKFWADWCQPCHVLTKVMEGMEYEPVDIETEEGSQLATHYGVRALPTLALFTDDGKLIEMKSGLMGKQDIERWIQSHES